MFQAKDLSEAQVAALKDWTEQGEQLSDLQRRLKEEFGITVTYMDMRFVALDLGLEFKSEEEAPEEEATEEAEVVEAVPQDGITLTVDRITRPGAYVSGRVTFSDGEQGSWMIDQTGRPSLDPNTPGYRPSQEDLMDFQMELRKALEEGGGMAY
ncbi:MAG: hypothetical protein Q7Q71_01595 [Verrucomicrobiota bacterium JB023]|nr:hypothetical protein [Verrucomicrobiota bacterium JB023]